MLSIRELVQRRWEREALLRYPGVITNRRGRAVWEGMCKTQKVRNTGGYETFWMVGVVAVFVVGVVLILLGWFMRKIVVFCRSIFKMDGSLERAFVADGKYQMQRLVYESDEGGVYRKWYDTETDYPWCLVKG